MINVFTISAIVSSYIAGFLTAVFIFKCSCKKNKDENLNMNALQRLSVHQSVASTRKREHTQSLLPYFPDIPVNYPRVPLTPVPEHTATESA